MPVIIILKELEMENSYEIINPKLAGHWTYGKDTQRQVHWGVEKKPRLLTRFMAKIFFELDWKND
jgi:hypothetical protein